MFYNYICLKKLHDQSDNFIKNIVRINKMEKTGNGGWEYGQWSLLGITGWNLDFGNIDVIIAYGHCFWLIINKNAK